MALESTNDWTLENKRYDRGLIGEDYFVVVDLYKGDQFRIESRWVVHFGEAEDDEEVTLRKWEAIAKSKDVWLMEHA